MVKGDTLVVTAGQEIDAAEIESLRSAARQHFVCGAKTVIVDLAATDFITSGGVAALLGLQREASAYKAQLLLCGMGDFLTAKLTRMGLLNCLCVISSTSPDTLERYHV